MKVIQTFFLLFIASGSFYCFMHADWYTTRICSDAINNYQLRTLKHIFGKDPILKTTIEKSNYKDTLEDYKKSFPDFTQLSIEYEGWDTFKIFPSSMGGYKLIHNNNIQDNIVGFDMVLTKIHEALQKPWRQSLDLGATEARTHRKLVVSASPLFRGILLSINRKVKIN